MYTNISSSFSEIINSNKGVITAKIKIGDTEIIGDSIYSVKCERASCDGAVGVGNLILPSLSFSISSETTIPVVVKGLETTFYIGVSADGAAYEYAPVLSMIIDSVKKSGELYNFETKSKFTCVDKVYKPSVNFPSTVLNVIADISTQLGVTIDTSGISDFAIKSQPAGYTCREVLCAIAERCGLNIHAARDDSKLIFKLYEDSGAVINPDCCDEPDLAVDPVNYKGVSCSSETSLITVGSAPYFTASNTLGYISATEDLETAKSNLTALTLYPGTIKLILGNILYDPWDLIGYSYNGKTISVPACSISHSYDGGLTTEIKIPEISSSNSDGTAQKTSQEQATERLIADLISTKLLVADKVSVDVLEATKAEIKNLYAEKAEFESLRATAATIENLKAVSGRVETLEANSITAAYVEANYAKINLANIANGAIKNIMIDVGAVGEAQIADGSITDAKIVELTANKITAGTLSVERLEIRGTDKSIVYALNNITGALQPQPQKFDTLNGEILTQRTITADKIVANAITSKEIAAKTITANEIATNTITADKLIVTTLSSITADLGTVTAGTIKSKNYVSRTSGMKLLLDTGEWDSKNFKISSDGSITATSGAIGGFTIGATYIANNTTSLAGAANSVYLGTNGISCGTTFKVTKAGALTATSGTIGGWSIGTSSIWGKSPATSDGQSYDVSFNVPLTFDDRHVVLGSNRNTSSSSTELKFAIYAGGMATFNKLDISGATTLWGGVDFRSSATFYSGLSCKDNIKTSGSIYTGDGNTIVNSAGYVGYFVKDAGGVQRTLLAYNPTSGVIGIAVGGFTDDDGNALSTTINIGTTATKTINLKGNSVTADAIITSKISSTTGTLSLPSITSGSISAGSVDVSGSITANTLTTSYGVTCASITATGATINGTATVNGLTVNGGVTAYSLTTTYGATIGTTLTATGITCGSYTTTADEMTFAKQIKAKGGIMLTNNAAVKSDLADGASNQILLRLNASNHVVIGQSGQSGKCYMYGVYNNASSGTVYNVQVNSAGLLSRASSSRRTKYNINYDIDSEAYHKALMSFKTAEFCLIGSTDRKLGMIAEDVETACSIAAVYEDEPVYDAQENVVGYRKTGLINNYDDRAIIQLLVLEAQRKDKEIAELRREINILKSIPIEEVI